MIPYAAGAVLAIASPGGKDAEDAPALVGTMRSRSGAELRYVTNDVRTLSKEMPTFGAYIDGEPMRSELISPEKETVEAEVRRLTKYLLEAPCSDGRKKVLNIFYAGHGRNKDGAWELVGGCMTGGDLFREIASAYGDCRDRLHVDLILDSCFSSRFLIDFIVDSQSNSVIGAFDCVVSSMPDERSWEFSHLEHGALTFNLTHSGNAYVDANELARAIDRQEVPTILKALQGVTVPNPVTFLTSGRQHPVILTLGHLLEVQGAGSVELYGEVCELTRDGMAWALKDAMTAYGETIVYSRDRY